MNGNAAVLGVLVAAAAVAVGAVMQFISIRQSRHDTRASIESASAQDQIDALVEVISEFSIRTYELVQGVAKARKGEDWPGKYKEAQFQAGILNNKLLMLLDDTQPADQRLQAAIERLRANDDASKWVDLNNVVMATAQEMFREKRRRGLR
jgi:hypothetical protein